MAYFYVKNGGTAAAATDNGRYATQQTGSFATLGAANYYGNVTDCFAATTPPTNGDYVCVGDAHTESPASVTYSTGLSSPNLCHVVSVDESNIDTLKAAAAAQNTPTGDVLVQNGFNFYGMYFKPGDDFLINGASHNLNAYGCTFDADGSGDRALHLAAQGARAYLEDCTVKVSNSGGSHIRITDGAYLTMVGGSVAGTSLSLTFESFGGIIDLTGVDLSALTNYIVLNYGEAITTDYVLLVNLRGCKLSASLTGFVEEKIYNTGARLSAFNCAATSAEAEYQFHIEAFGGYVDDQVDSGIHRGESIPFPSGERVSAHCVTNTDPDKDQPFWFDLPARYTEFSAASYDTVRIYLASTASLTELDVWAELIYPDGTNKHEFNKVSTRNTDPFDTTGTALTSDTGSTWKDGASDLVGYNEYYIDLDTSADAGSDGVPLIRIYVGKASTTIYFDVAVDFV